MAEKTKYIFFLLSAELPRKLCQLQQQQQRRSLHGTEERISSRQTCPISRHELNWVQFVTPEEEMSKTWPQHRGATRSGQVLTDVRTVPRRKRWLKGNVQFHAPHAVAVFTQHKDILLPGRVSFLKAGNLKHVAISGTIGSSVHIVNKSVMSCN